jgi:inhibitor of cysteine peptidase
MFHRVISILLLGAALIACAGIPGGQVRDHVMELVAADHDRPVILTVGETVSVRLDANRTTGYTWLLADATIAKGALIPVHPESRYERDINGIYSMGAGAMEIWEFQAVEAGEGALRLEYRRPFEPNVPPLRTLVFPVTVYRP